VTEGAVYLPCARVEHGHGSDDILASMRGRMGGILGRDGEPVITGQPVAWMEASPERPA
jgi:hypothetical protein